MEDSFNLLQAKFAKLIAQAHDSGNTNKETYEFLVVNYPKIKVFY